MDKYQRIEADDDPRRCQGNDAHGQCRMVAIEGSTYCIRHGGHSVKMTVEKDQLRNLKLTKFRVRLAQLGSSTHIMSLRDEIGVTRMTLEQLIESCEGPADLITMSGQISVLVGNIGKLVKDCHSIEEKTGHLLSKDALTNFAGKMIEIIIKYVKDEDLKRTIAGEIVDAVADAGGPEDQ